MNLAEAHQAFYMRLNDDSRTVAAMDMPAPGISEIIAAASARNASRSSTAVCPSGIDREHYAWYRDLRRYGTVPTPALGFERTLAYVTGLANVRDAIPSRAPPGNARCRPVLPSRSARYWPMRAE